MGEPCRDDQTWVWDPPKSHPCALLIADEAAGQAAMIPTGNVYHSLTQVALAAAASLRSCYHT
jgi:hypothetical protein